MAIRHVKGGEELKAQLRKLGALKKQRLNVVVGLPRGSTNYPDGTSLIMVGAVHEFGSDKRNIPERPYLRTTLREQEPEIKKFWNRNANKILLGLEDPERLIKLIGLKLENDVKQKITDIKSPPLAPSTIANRKRKIVAVGGDPDAPGSVNPLVDTGHLRQSIRHEIRRGRLT